MNFCELVSEERNVGIENGYGHKNSLVAADTERKFFSFFPKTKRLGSRHQNALRIIRTFNRARLLDKD